MTNIVITTAAITLMLSVPAGALISVQDNNQEIASFTASENAEGKPVDQINVVVSLNSPTQTGTQAAQITISAQEPAQAQAQTSQAPTATRTAPQPTVNNFANLPQPQQMLNQATTQTTTAPQPIINNFQNVPNAAPADYSNIIRNPGGQNTSATTTTPQTQEIEQLRSEVQQLRQQLQQAQQNQPQVTVAPQPKPSPQNSRTETTVINPITNLPERRIITTVQENVTPTPTLRVTPRPTNISQIGRGTSVSNSASGQGVAVGSGQRSFGTQQFQQQTQNALRAAQGTR